MYKVSYQMIDEYDWALNQVSMVILILIYPLNIIILAACMLLVFWISVHDQNFICQLEFDIYLFCVSYSFIFLQCDVTMHTRHYIKFGMQCVDHWIASLIATSKFASTIWNLFFFFLQKSKIISFFILIIFYTRNVKFHKCLYIYRTTSQTFSFFNSISESFIHFKNNSM